MAVSAAELSAVPYLAELPPSALAALSERVQARAYARGAILFLEGEPCQGLCYLQQGRVRVYKAAASGREQVLMMVAAGETFNDVPVFDSGPNPASAQAVEPSRVLVIPREVMLEIMRAHPAVGLAVVGRFAARLRQLTVLVEDLSLRHVTGRLARLLLRGPDDAPPERLTQQEMAARVGTAREVVGRALRALEEAGAIELRHGRVFVRDRAALEKLA